jgi:hypothetical protein
MANPSLGGSTKNHFKELLRSKKQPNQFFGPFTLSVFTTIIFLSCLSLACTNIWFEVYFGIKKSLIIIFKILIKMAPSKIDSLNFENS